MKNNQLACGAVIVAAGTASRMGGIDKVMADLGGMPMICRTLNAFAQCEEIDEIVVVTRQDLISKVESLCKEISKVKAVVAGGNTRAASVEAGLDALSDDVVFAAIHDGARPLISESVIVRTLQAAREMGAAAPAIAVKDTIKVSCNGMITSTPKRDTLRAVQTPQIFSRELLKKALQQSDCAEITDDCSAVEKLEHPVRLVDGDERNIKITTPMDLKIAEMLLEEMV